MKKNNIYSLEIKQFGGISTTLYHKVLPRGIFWWRHAIGQKMFKFKEK